MLLIENYLVISFLITIFWCIIKKKRISTLIVMAIFSPIFSVFLIGIYASAVFVEHK